MQLFYFWPFLFCQFNRTFIENYIVSLVMIGKPKFRVYNSLQSDFIRQHIPERLMLFQLRCSLLSFGQMFSEKGLSSYPSIPFYSLFYIKLLSSKCTKRGQLIVVKMLIELCKLFLSLYLLKNLVLDWQVGSIWFLLRRKFLSFRKYQHSNRSTSILTNVSE